MSPAKKPRWKLGTCGRCEWITHNAQGPCPKCGWGLLYSAFYTYGDKAYEYQYSQEPWKARKLKDYEVKLNDEIGDPRPKKETPEMRLLNTIFGTSMRTEDTLPAKSP